MRRALLIGLALLAACARNLREPPPASEPASPQVSRAPPPREERPSAALIAEGLASYYGEDFRGRRTANGERFDPDAFTAAHRTLPFQSCVVVEHVASGRKVQVRINDRGPYSGHRILDLSKRAARELRMIADGVARVRLWTCGAAPG